MVKVKEMPFEERYAKVTDNMKFDESFILPFAKQHLGDKAVNDLKEIWQKGFKPIPQRASSEEKYETAYQNWIWLATNTYSFIRKRWAKRVLKSSSELKLRD